MFPIWFENTTDEVKSLELENDITNYKDLPEGVICHVGIDSSYRELLARFEGHGDYRQMKLNKVFTRNTAQITQVVSVVDYTDAEKPTQTPIITQTYFSPNQFSSNLLSIGNGINIFDLTRIKGENEIKKDGNGHEYNTPTSNIEKKQKLVFNILPKTKVALICSLERKSIPLPEKDDYIKTEVK